MSECCGPLSGEREPADPVRTAQYQEINERRASERGLTMEQYYNADKLVSPINHLRAWLKDAWLNFQLWLP